MLSRYYLSLDNKLSGDDPLIGEFTFPGVPPGGGTNANVTLSIPSLATAQYYIFGVLDPQNEIAETREQNNVYDFPFGVCDDQFRVPGCTNFSR